MATYLIAMTMNDTSLTVANQQFAGFAIKTHLGKNELINNCKFEDCYNLPEFFSLPHQPKKNGFLSLTLLSQITQVVLGNHIASFSQRYFYRLCYIRTTACHWYQ